LWLNKSWSGPEWLCHDLRGKKKVAQYFFSTPHSLTNFFYSAKPIVTHFIILTFPHYGSKRLKALSIKLFSPKIRITMIAPSQSQSQDELGASVRKALKSGRPILTHLNEDTTWLIQIPYPKSARPSNGRYFFNILIDPWLSGPQSDVAWWFSTQYHNTKSYFQTIEELNAKLEEIQEIASDSNGDDGGSITKSQLTTYIDVVAISHEFTDHCRQSPSVKFFHNTSLIC
jgi:hypothetical protein